jgi:hypothetical protein
MAVPIERLRRRCDRTSNIPRAGFKAATHRALAFRATRVLRSIRVRIGSGLAVRGDQRGNPRRCDYGTLQSDDKHHDDGDELTLHGEKLNRLKASRQTIGQSMCGICDSCLQSERVGGDERPLTGNQFSGWKDRLWPTWTSQLLLDTDMAPCGCFKISRTEAT